MTPQVYGITQMLDNYRRLVVFYTEDEPNENLVEYFEDRVKEYEFKLVVAETFD